MGRKKQEKKVADEELHGVDDDEIHGLDDDELHEVADAELHGFTDGEECSVDVQKNKRGPTSMCKLTAAARRGKKAKIDYDDMGRPSYNANGKALQSYIGSVARSMVPISTKSWPTVPENIKQKVWEEISNVFELAPQSEAVVMSSAAQKWRDFKNKLTSRFVWPNRGNPEKLSSPPGQYQLPKADWKAFVDERLHPSWEVTHEKQKERTMHCKYHHRLSRKGYIGLEAELREKKIIAENEEVDRSVLWRKAREDKSGNITNMETAKVAAKIDDLLEMKVKGEFKSSGMNDVLTTAIGSQEHYGRVRGVGGFVKPQVYFKTPRKKRESVTKALADNFKEQLEETKSLKAEVEKLKAQLAQVMPLMNDRTSEPVASNKSSNMKDTKLSDDVEVYECDTSNMEGKKCHLVVKQRENVVAYGTIVSEGGPNVMLHHVPLGEGNFKVSVDVVLDEGAELPIPIKSGPTIVSDAVGTIVGWPKELVIFPTTKKKVKSQPFALSDIPGHRDKFKNIEKTLPMACKYIYSYVVRLMPEEENIHVDFDEAMFGHPKSVWLLRDDILRFMEMKEIGARQILVYMGYLYKYLKERNRADYVSFVDPGNIPTCGVGEDGSKLSQHITDQLEAASRDSICLIPYNTGYHWILTIVNEEKNMVYLLDSMGNRNRDNTWKTIVTNGVKMYNALKGIPKGPGFKQLTGNLKQRGCVECGYCVMRYMKEIVEHEDPQLEKKFGGSIKNQYYNQAHYDELRSEWSEFVYSFVGV